MDTGWDEEREMEMEADRGTKCVGVSPSVRCFANLTADMQKYLSTHASFFVVRFPIRTRRHLAGYKSI